MDTMLTIWWSVCGLLTLAWALRHENLTRVQRKCDVLSASTYSGQPANAPKVSVLVAAKDEESCIETCVRSLLAQDYPNFEVIIVNDRSCDRTGEILESLATEFKDRLRVHTITELPAGWMGKVNAMRVGVASADGAYLLFSDADCEQVSKRTISVAMQYTLEHQVEFLSLIPVIKPSCVWEAMIQPVCTAILMIWHQPHRVNNPKRKEAYANGAFMLLRRDIYERIGGHGHDRVRHALNEDIEMARLAKESGVRLVAMQNRDLYTTRMYASFMEVWLGWTRIYLGCFQSPRRVIRAAAVLTVFSILPVVSVVASAVMLAVGNPEQPSQWWWVLATSSACWFMLQTVIFRYYRMIGAPWWRSLTYTGAALFCFGILMNALRKTLGFGATTWRGTSYHAQTTKATAHAG